MKVVIVTEGSNGRGYGHMTRCLAIYQAFEERGIPPTYVVDSDGIGAQFLGPINRVVLDWRNNMYELLRLTAHSDLIVVDSYQADAEVYERLRQSSGKTLYLDDYLRIDYPPGIIVNGTVGAERLPYPNDRGHRHLLGIDYAPLRKEFWDTCRREGRRDISNVLLTFGGEDYRNLAATTLRCLLEVFPEYTYHVVGGSNSEEAGHKVDSQKVNFYGNVQAADFLRLFMSCDLAISSAGQTLYELARVGLPTIAIGMAENQRHTIRGWVESGFLQSELWWDDTDLAERLVGEMRILSGRDSVSKEWCDGQGARRIIRYLCE